MSVSYQQLLHNVALRLNALVGTQAVALETTYATAALTAADFKSADWPFSSFRDSILMAEAEFAQAIADTGNHPWRRVLAAVTPALAHEAALPSHIVLDPIIGVWGAVHDATDNTPCTEQPIEVVRRIVAETWRTYPLYYYKFDDGRVYHTRVNVLVDCCIFNRSTRLAAWNASASMLLPDVLEAPITARALSLMPRIGAYAGQVEVYRNYSIEALTAIRAGLTSIPAKTLPSPTPVSTAA